MESKPYMQFLHYFFGFWPYSKGAGRNAFLPKISLHRSKLATVILKTPRDYSVKSFN